MPCGRNWDAFEECSDANHAIEDDMNKTVIDMSIVSEFLKPRIHPFDSISRHKRDLYTKQNSPKMFVAATPHMALLNGYPRS